ncbi:MAG: hypothetical protein Q4D58_12075 [Synergistaceae bacterium]|nr:hypothetical protein [Synergistaceae bacterium]
MFLDFLWLFRLGSAFVFLALCCFCDCGVGFCFFVFGFGLGGQFSLSRLRRQLPQGGSLKPKRPLNELNTRWFVAFNARARYHAFIAQLLPVFENKAYRLLKKLVNNGTLAAVNKEHYAKYKIS